MVFRPAGPHGALEEVFADVFVTWSSFRAGVGVAFDRTMTVVRQGGELVVIGSARLTDAGEAELAKLGKVRHVVRTAAFHGADDPYYVDKFGATLWGGSDGRALTAADHPFTAATVFGFEGAVKGVVESAVLLSLDGGVLVTGDSFLNWTTFDNCSWLARRLMPRLGFGAAVIGKPWLKRVGEGVRADFARLVELPFKHVIPGHGSVLRDHARDAVCDAVTARFSA
jgi:hypothetical protein